MMLSASYRCFLCLSIGLAFYAKDSHGDNTEYAPVDGFRNNLGQPTLGIAGSNFVRASPTAYSDGAYNMAGQDRPDPMDISLEVHAGRSARASGFSRNSLQAFYAQLVLDEVALVTPGCPPEYENMQLPEKHPLRNFTKRPQVYQRSLYDQSTGYLSGGPRQQINVASSFVDGGIIYGTSKTWASLIRSYSNGTLLADTADISSSFPKYNDVGLPLINAPIPRDHEMKAVDRLFRLGNAKGHESPFLLALQVIWFRWHNKVAADIAVASGADLTDEEIFQRAKKMVVAHFQKILVKDWLPAFLNGNQTNVPGEILPAYTKYDSRQHPGVTHEFLAAMDFRHTITPAAVWNLK
ncbi:hypothetical protein BsWGS_01848 [Bradybaena similaris]